MGFVVAKIKIMPKDMESFEELKASLKDQVEVMEEEPIAFGMNALLVLFKMEDVGGAQDKIEEKLRQNPLISSFEIMSVGRV
ncbi:MAG: elongation factor 1-beta [Candidatus Altiarchaeota archaeon]|nr:elongation factor 1-beta [Candidatus Altiarchaeota archaeon]